MLFGKKIEVEEKEINHAYEEFQNNLDIILLCADEQRNFDQRHPVDAQCFPLRIIDAQAKDQLDPDAIYYVYALRKGTAYDAVKKLLKQGFNAYCIGSFLEFKGPEEGLNVKTKRSKHHRQRK